jgi:putative ABC transport system ATP-binding protein
MSEPETRAGALGLIGRSVEVAPALRAGFATSFALAAVGAGARVAVPVILQQAIDGGISGGRVDMGRVTFLAAVGVVIVLIASAAQRAAVVRLGVRSEQALYGLRVALFGHIHRLSLADHAEEKRGALVSRVTSDIETLQQFFGWGALIFLLDGTLIVVVALVMVAYDWLLASVVFVVAAPLAFFLGVVQKRLVSAYEKTREINAELLGAVSEMVTGEETLHAYGATSVHPEQIATAANRRTRAHVRASIYGAVMFPMGEVFAVFSVCAVVALGVWRGPESGLTSGALVGFVFLTYRFLEPVAEFTEVFDQTQSAIASLRRVVGVLDTPVGPPPSDDPLSLPPGRLSLEVRDVDFAYRNRVDGTLGPLVLRDVSLTVAAGSTVALVGHTGSGKSTLGRLLARFADPVSGEVVVGGVDIRRVDNDELRRRVVAVPQEPFLFDDSILENLRFASPGATRESCDDAFRQLGLGDWIDSLPLGIDTRVGERGDSLSAGERQLVALGRASLSDPDVLILDEATSSVDALTEVRLSRALEKLSEGRTTIAIAHRLSTAARADVVVLMEDGRIVEQGPHAVLVASGGKYAELHRSWIAATSTEASSVKE